MARPEDAYFSLDVNGYASFSRLAERASVSLAVTHTDTSKQSVSEKVLSTALLIEQQLKDIQVKFRMTRDEVPQTPGQDTSLPIAHWSKTSLASTSHMDFHNWDPRVEKRPEPVRKYTARIDFDLRFRDFDALGHFTSTTAGIDYCEMQGVNWYLLPSTKKSYESRLRKAAAADAMAKVKDYCSVLFPGVDTINLKPHSFTGENNAAAFNHNSFARAQPMMQSMQAQSAPGFGASARGGGDSGDSGSSGLSFTPKECKLELTITLYFRIETKGYALPLRDDFMSEA